MSEISGEKSGHAIVLTKCKEIVSEPNAVMRHKLTFKNSWGSNWGINGKGEFSVELPCRGLGKLTFIYIRIKSDAPENKVRNFINHSENFSLRQQYQLNPVRELEESEWENLEELEKLGVEDLEQLTKLFRLVSLSSSISCVSTLFNLGLIKSLAVDDE